jgi:hypothetical protein
LDQRDPYDAMIRTRLMEMRAQAVRAFARPSAVGGIDRSGLRAAIRKIGLPSWFVAIDLLFQFLDPHLLLTDSRLYQQATDAWLAGGDPWALNVDGIYYAAAPWSLLTYIPTAWLPLEVASWSWALLGIGAAVWTLRRLELPLWWLAFPPLAEALWNGNAQPVVLAALLMRHPWGVTLAAALKIYGIVPPILARRWREVAIAAVVLSVTLPFLPWGMWIEHRLGFDAATNLTWNGSAWRFPVLIPIAAAALVVLRHRGGEWLAIPAVWPGTQFFYHVFALPTLRDKPWLAAALGLPMPLLAPCAVIAYAVLAKRTPPVSVAGFETEIQTST